MARPRTRRTNGPTEDTEDEWPDRGHGGGTDQNQSGQRPEGSGWRRINSARVPAAAERRRSDGRRFCAARELPHPHYSKGEYCNSSRGPGRPP
eukprot:scaffold77_cov116-Isochrysis_galbana.AAC.12